MFNLKGAINAPIWKISKNVLKNNSSYQSVTSLATINSHLFQSIRTIVFSAHSLLNNSQLCASHTQIKASNSITNNGHTPKRNYSSNVENNEKKPTDIQPIVKTEEIAAKPFKPILPTIMKFPLKHLQTGLLMTPPFQGVLSQISPYYRKFDPNQFKRGAKEALITTMKLLAARDYDQLRHLIAPNTLKVLKSHVEFMTDEQRQRIAISRNDRVDVYMYQFDIIDVEGLAFLEMTTVFRVITIPKQLNEVKITQLPDLFIKFLGFDENTRFCYCSFIAQIDKVDEDEEYSDDEEVSRKGFRINEDWTVYRLSHFNLLDVVRKFLWQRKHY